MTHDPDRNIFTAPLDTDVFDWLYGEGFVMVGSPAVKLPTTARRTEKSSDLNAAGFSTVPMPSVADEVRELEGLLR